MKKTIVLTGGGTAGHVIPALSLVDELKKYFDRVVYIGRYEGVERTLAEKKGLEYYGTQTVKLDRNKPFSNIKIPSTLLKGKKECIKILKEIKPSVVFAKGGYVSLPTVLAAKSLSIPIVLHESDYTLGVANRVCLRYAKKLLTSFEETHKRGIVTGNPIRKEIFEGNNRISFESDKKVILFVGGSSGARAIDQCVKESLPKLGDYYVIHIKGRDIECKESEEYLPLDYVENIWDYYKVADIVITRGGANALSELVALGKRIVVIPLPKGGSRGDQIKNAEYYRRKGRLTILEQDRLTPDTLIESIKVGLNGMEYPPSNQTNIERVVKEIIEVI